MRRALALSLPLWLLAAPAHAAFGPLAYPLDDWLRLNDLQAKGTHNSYHLRSLLYNDIPFDFDYAHAPLPEQLDHQGVRKFELDLYWDERGFRVHHENRFDKETSCATLLHCLGILRAWSLRHPGHHPIFLFIEPKGVYSETTLSDEPITGHYDQLDAEVRAVLEPPGGPDLLIDPDEVRGAFQTLADAVRTAGWPPLRETRGRFFGAMLDRGADRDGYTEGRPSLEGRALFVTSTEGRPDAAVFAVDDPVGQFDRIRTLVSLGYVVRTRADALRDAQAGDTTRREAAFASGAHYISTDYPVPEILDNGYAVEIPDGTPSRCNPETSPDLGGFVCIPLDVENPAALAVRAPEPEAGAGLAAALAALLGSALGTGGVGPVGRSSGLGGVGPAGRAPGHRTRRPGRPWLRTRRRRAPAAPT